MERLGRGANDVLVRTAHSDDLVGMGGNDVLRGLAGDDTLDGGPGGDVLQGGAGRDELTGGPQVDVLEGRAGSDKIYAADRVRDVIRCGSGTDVVFVDRRDRPHRDCGVARVRGVPFGASLSAGTRPLTTARRIVRPETRSSMASSPTESHRLLSSVWDTALAAGPDVNVVATWNGSRTGAPVAFARGVL